MAGVDQLEWIGPQHVKTTRRGATHKRCIQRIVIELATQIPLAKHNRARGILRLIGRLDHARRIDGTRRSTAKLHGIAYMRRYLGRGMAHNQRHHTALAAARIHYALNARLMRALAQNNQSPRLNNRSLLPRNGLERVTQDARVVEPDARNGNGDGIGRTRGVPTAAHANLKHGNIHASLGKHHKCSSRQKVKRRDGIGALPRRHTTGIHSMPRLNSGRNAAGKRLIAHDASIDFHALGIAYQLWRRIQRGLEPLTTKNGSRKTRSRSLAIGTGNLNAIKVLVRMPQLIEHIDNRLKQRPSIPRNPPRISSKPDSFIKRKQLKRERHRIRPRTLSHNPSLQLQKKRPTKKNEPLALTISAFIRLQQNQGHNPVALPGSGRPRNRYGSGLGLCSIQVPHEPKAT